MKSMFADDINIKRCGEQHLRKFFETGKLEGYKYYSGERKKDERIYLYVIIPRISCGVISYRDIVIRIHVYNSMKQVHFFNIDGTFVYHPHIYTDGGACMGGFNTSKKAREKDADLYIVNILLFLQSINTGSLVNNINYTATNLKKAFPLVRKIPSRFIMNNVQLMKGGTVNREMEDNFFYFYCNDRNKILNHSNTDKIIKFIKTRIQQNNDYFSEVLLPQVNGMSDNRCLRNILGIGIITYLSTEEIIYLTDEDKIYKEIDVNKEIRIIKNVLYKILYSDRIKTYKKEMIKQMMEYYTLRTKEINDYYELNIKSCKKTLDSLKEGINEINNK